MTNYSQRDARWANHPLGFSTSTIAKEGCLITALANIIGTTPNIVNERLKAINGFAPVQGADQRKLVIWAKVMEAFPGIQVDRRWTYTPEDNEVVKNNLPCIVQVDGSPIGAPMHFVVYIGNGQLLDSWDGQVKPTSTYVAQSYALIKGQWQQEVVSSEVMYQGLDLTNRDSMKVAVDVWARLRDGELVDKAQFNIALHSLQELVSHMGIEFTPNEREEMLRKAKEQIDNYMEEVGQWKKKANENWALYEAEKQRVLDLKNEISQIHKEDKDYGQEALEAERLAKERGDFIKMIAEDLGVQYDPNNDKAVVDEVLRKIAIVKQQESPENHQLNSIANHFVSMGINTYLVGRGIEPIRPGQEDPQIDEKIRLYLTDLANELLDKGSSSPVAPVEETPVKRSIRLPRPQLNIMQKIVRPIINLFIVQK